MGFRSGIRDQSGRKRQALNCSAATLLLRAFWHKKKGGPVGPPFFLRILPSYLDVVIAASLSSLRFSTSILIKSSLLGFFPRTISS